MPFSTWPYFCSDLCNKVLTFRSECRNHGMTVFPSGQIRAKKDSKTTMNQQRVGHFIFGITHTGNKFRPSDWIERVAAVFARYDASHRLCYDTMIMPVKYEELPCLFVDSHFAIENPAGCEFVSEFVRSNHLQIKSTAPIDLVLCISPEKLKAVA